MLMMHVIFLQLEIDKERRLRLTSQVIVAPGEFRGQGKNNDGIPALPGRKSMAMMLPPTITHSN
jgi:hypothetical protein